MDINDLLTQDKHEAGAEIRIKNAKGQKTDFYITVMGVDSKEYQRQLKKIKNAAYRAIAAGDDITPDHELDDDVNRLAAITLGWRGLVDNGKEVKFTQKTCKEFYAKAPPVRQQIENFIGNTENFTKG